MRQLTWTCRALREGGVVTIRAVATGTNAFQARLERAGGGGEPFCSGAFTSPDGALEDLEASLREHLAARTAALCGAR